MRFRACSLGSYYQRNKKSKFSFVRLFLLCFVLWVFFFFFFLFLSIIFNESPKTRAVARFQSVLYFDIYSAS